MGFGVEGLGFRVQGLGFRVTGAGCRVQGAGCRVEDLLPELLPSPLSLDMLPHRNDAVDDSRERRTCSDARGDDP